ncbi:hypothetical protein [Actinopolymorpha rutila]|uniref:Uncharacterized protein n=1 Tax=Actinopolymorpha rutila TaxID=446787 RepID=A0A852Z8Y4_9ACTN|nr:hypothetical protein [Actinopolymorpha rutila]NYH88675.1 hypothetical protein [Actinopolymorpha rutila]
MLIVEPRSYGRGAKLAAKAWLATVSDRVDAVVSGGFPLAADYRPILDMVETGTAAAAGGDGVVDDFAGLKKQEAAFAERDRPFRRIGSYSHDEMLENLELVLSDVDDWLTGISDGGGRHEVH